MGENAGDDRVAPGVHQDAVVSALGVAVQAGRDVTVTVHRAGPVRVAWPVRVGVPPTPADHYQQRQAHAALAETLAAGQAAVVVGAARRVGVVVSGLGGVGKTQLAARHAWSVWLDTSVDVAVWVPALSRDAVITAYAEAAARVLVKRDPSIDGRSPEKAAGLFREWLADTSRRWLVVLDDVQDPADLRGLEPPAGPGGQVVITSRLRDAALARGGHRVIELSVFTPEEAVTYLSETLTGTTDGSDRDQLARLAAELGWLPLALGQAAAYLADQPLIGVSDYRAMLADRRRTLAELTPPEHALPEHQLTIATTWSLSIERADRVDDTTRPNGVGLARALLELASLLDPNGIPLAVFTAPPVLDYLATLAGREISVADIRDGLTRLHRFTLVTLTPNRPARAVTVHALVQRAVRDELTPGRLHTLAHTTANALHAAWPDIDRTTPGLEQALRTGTDNLHANSTPALLTSGLHPVLARVGHSLGNSGQVHAATAYWRDLNDQARTQLAPHHPDTLATRHGLAYWRGKAGDPAGAATDLAVLLTDHLQVLGPDHPGTLTTRHDLARSRGGAGDPAGAVIELEALLTDRQRILGPDHPDTLTTRHHLAYWRGRAGDPAGAATELEVLLTDRQRILGPDHPDTLTTRGNLAYWRGEAGDLAGAVTEVEVLLTDHVRVLGPDHPNTLITRGNLARSRGGAGDPAGAVVELEALLIDRQRILGPNHPNTLATRHNLAYWRGRSGDTVGAAAELEGLLTDRRRVLGSDHPDTSATHQQLVHWREVVQQQAADSGA